MSKNRKSQIFLQKIKIEKNSRLCALHGRLLRFLGVCGLNEIALVFPVPDETLEVAVMTADNLYGSSMDAWDRLGASIVCRHLAYARGLPIGVMGHYVGHCIRLHMMAEESPVDVWTESVELTVAWLAGRRDVAVSLADQGVISRDDAARMGMLSREDVDQILDGEP